METLLVVDDNEQNRYMAEVLLTNSGYQVTLAKNGIEALEKAHKDPPSLILADILMPVMDGFALCREWKMDDRLKSIPFIFFTATYTDTEDEQFGLSLGADRFLIKPIPPETLVSTIREVLDRSPVDSASASAYDIPEDDVYLRKYNQALIHKLEDKLDELEAANKQLEDEIRERQRAEEEKCRLEQQLIQSQKMEALGTLAGGIAHDFNNILMGIRGFVNIATIRMLEGKSNQTHLQEIALACDRAKELVAQILTFSRQSDREHSPVHVKSIVNEVLKMMRSSLPANIEMKKKLESDSLIMANPTQIHQVLMNLCTNACQAIKADRGRIDITMNDVRLDDTFNPSIAPGKYLKLEVSDTGVGMTPDQQKHIFDPYFTTKQKGEGTGLGLSVVHGIVSESGGMITARSEINKGSTFSAYFPLIDSKAVVSLPTGKQPEGGREHIVLIDDEPTLLQIGTEFLEEIGYQVTAFNDSLDAVEHVQSDPDGVDLVITDMTMPGLTGDKLTQKLLKIRSDLPIILCTGFSRKITKQNARELGIKAFLTKPVELGDLSKAIRQVLDNMSPQKKLLKPFSAKDKGRTPAKMGNNIDEKAKEEGP